MDTNDYINNKLVAIEAEKILYHVNDSNMAVVLDFEKIWVASSTCDSGVVLQLSRILLGPFH